MFVWDAWEGDGGGGGDVSEVWEREGEGEEGEGEWGDGAVWVYVYLVSFFALGRGREDLVLRLFFFVGADGFSIIGFAYFFGKSCFFFGSICVFCGQRRINI